MVVSQDSVPDALGYPLWQETPEETGGTVYLQERAALLSSAFVQMEKETVNCEGFEYLGLFF